MTNKWLESIIQIIVTVLDAAVDSIVTFIYNVAGLGKPFVKVLDKLVDGLSAVVEHTTKKAKGQWMAVSKKAKLRSTVVNAIVIPTLRDPLSKDLGAIVWR